MLINILILFGIPALLIGLSKINKVMATTCGCCWVSLLFLMSGNNVFIFKTTFGKFLNVFACVVIAYYGIDMYVKIFERIKKEENN